MEPSPKRAKTLADNPDCFSGESSVGSSGNEMEFLGPKGLLRRSEFIRIIIDALSSLGFHVIATLLENESGILLHSSIAKQFLKLVEHGEWDKSIDALQGFELRDEKAVKFLLLEQKSLELMKMGKSTDALQILEKEMIPLGINSKRIRELAYQFFSLEDTETVISRSKVVDKLQNLFPHGVLFPKRRLEYLLEETLDRKRICCDCRNNPDRALSLCYDHHNTHCYYHKIPSETAQTLDEHTGGVRFVKFSHNGKYLASSSEDKSAIIWVIDAEGKFLVKHILVGHENPVVMVLWSPDDRYVMTCGENEIIKCWDVDSGENVQSYASERVGSVSCGWFHDGSGIIGGMADGSICLWTLDGMQLKRVQGPRGQKLSDVAMTTDGKWLVSMGRAREISFCDRETFRVEKVIREEDMITSFSLSKDSKHILINLSTKGINQWSIEGDDPFKHHKYNGHKRSQFIIRSCCGGNEESFIASGSEDCQVYIWNRADSIFPLRTLQGHTGVVRCVSWNPTDLHMLASACDDGTIRIWGLSQKNGEFVG